MFFFCALLAVQGTLHRVPIDVIQMTNGRHLELVTRNVDMPSLPSAYRNVEVHTLEAIKVGTPTIKFKQLDDLKGYVLIDSGQQALRFVRLRTTKWLWGALESTPLSVELVDKVQVTSEFLLGRVDCAKELLQSGMGIVDAGPALAEVSSNPRIRKSGTSYIIKRLVAIWRDSSISSQQCKITESVDRDGKYKLISISPIVNGPVSELDYRLRIRM